MGVISNAANKKKPSSGAAAFLAGAKKAAGGAAKKPVTVKLPPSYAAKNAFKPSAVKKAQMKKRYPSTPVKNSVSRFGVPRERGDSGGR